jgi:hypothetical protein
MDSSASRLLMKTHISVIPGSDLPENSTVVERLPVEKNPNVRATNASLAATRKTTLH